ncbi:HAD superfamily hydrolase (TIGR01490 family) [Sinobacterium caligoides]|uniref:Histidinol-phosphatase n=1 Tax=Sinobacterium caligoides TaxID=933926 RepID=A0A3N2DGC7_9GAMM|nr:HAD family hydrolase [Sinobacterium caligoides]ROR98850.1 HAD superfamily hydrolase (TIGR01490 family) [Sinobacterium caligoides]
MTLAIFDLDNTLIGGDSDHLWGEFLVANNLVDVGEFKKTNDQFYEDYKAGQLDIVAYQEFSLAPLTQYSSEQLEQMHRQFMQQVITPIRLTKAEQLIQQHRQQGHTLLIITATNLFVTGPIAEALGIEHILATEGEIIDGRYSGKMQGTPCFQAGKITRLEAWLKESNEDMAGAYFYSDSHNDLPLLKLVDHPVAVDADETLREHAKQQGWPIISLRD